MFALLFILSLTFFLFFIQIANMLLYILVIHAMRLASLLYCFIHSSRAPYAHHSLFKQNACRIRLFLKQLRKGCVLCYFLFWRFAFDFCIFFHHFYIPPGSLLSFSTDSFIFFAA